MNPDDILIDDEPHPATLIAALLATGILGAALIIAAAIATAWAVWG